MVSICQVNVGTDPGASCVQVLRNSETSLGTERVSKSIHTVEIICLHAPWLNTLKLTFFLNILIQYIDIPSVSSVSPTI